MSKIIDEDIIATFDGRSLNKWSLIDLISKPEYLCIRHTLTGGDSCVVGYYMGKPVIRRVSLSAWYQIMREITEDAFEYPLQKRGIIEPKPAKQERKPKKPGQRPKPNELLKAIVDFNEKFGIKTEAIQTDPSPTHWTEGEGELKELLSREKKTSDKVKISDWGESIESEVTGKDFIKIGMFATRQFGIGAGTEIRFYKYSPFGCKVYRYTKRGMRSELESDIVHFDEYVIGPFSARLAYSKKLDILVVYYKKF